MTRFSHTINMAIFWLFLLLAIVLSLANWGIILFSIVDTVIIHSAKAILVYKIWAALAISAVILSHAFFYQIMYDPTISSRMFPILNIVIYHSIIKKMRKNAQLLSTKELIILYLKGQLMTYLIRVKQ